MRKLLYIIAILLVAIACEPERKDVMAVTPQRASFSFEGGSGKVGVVSPIAWVATCDAQWVVIDSTTSTAAYYHLAVNRASSPRYATITISGSNENHQVLIEQASPPSGQPERAFDSLALVALSKECDGQNWYYNRDTLPTPWQFGKPITQWEGITTSVIDGQVRVVGINLSGVGVAGKLPEVMSDLTQLQVFMMRYNQIEGNAISICAKFPELIYLDLSSNDLINFADTPPAGSFTKLQHLNLSVCKIYGAIPRWALQPSLIEFSISSCNISGQIAPQIANMSNLTKLDLSHNDITGEIPAWLTSLTQLTYLDLATCRLTGRIPEDIGNLSSLQVFKLAGNKLNGPIPVSVAQMKNLHTLNLSDNSFTNFPSTIIANCGRLKYVDIAFNNIEGTLSPLWATLNDLEYLIVLKNRMSGTIPDELLNDRRWARVWHAKSLICPQQEGYGFSNDPFKVGLGTGDVGLAAQQNYNKQQVPSHRSQVPTKR